MLNANTGSSTNVDPRAAGREAAAKAKAGLASMKVAFAYASVDYDLEEMLRGISEELPGIPVIGNTSFTGVITPEGFISGKGGFWGFWPSRITNCRWEWLRFQKRAGRGPRGKP